MASSTLAASAIALDDEATWPERILGYLDENVGELRAFEAERRRIDQLCERDVDARWSPPQNRYETHRRDAISVIDEAIACSALIGYHCTRLEDAEYDLVLSEGLRPLSSAFVAERVNRVVRRGLLCSTVGYQLLQANLASRADRGRRQQTVWFIFTRSLLQESGVWRLLSYWGGEAVYSEHENDQEVGPLLRGVGTATIVCAAVPVRWIKPTGRSCGERLLNGYLTRRGVATADGPEMEGCIEQPLPPELIERIVTRSNPEFARLTGCDGWSRAIT